MLYQFIMCCVGWHVILWYIVYMIALVTQLFGHGFAVVPVAGRGEVLLDFGRGLAPPRMSGSLGVWEPGLRAPVETFVDKERGYDGALKKSSYSQESSDGHQCSQWG